MSFPGWLTDRHISPSISTSNQQHSNKWTWSKRLSSTKPAVRNKHLLITPYTSKNSFVQDTQPWGSKITWKEGSEGKFPHVLWINKLFMFRIITGWFTNKRLSHLKSQVLIKMKNQPRKQKTSSTLKQIKRKRPLTVLSLQISGC